ncbi:MAG TPA: ATP-binding cassette domain-containing protein [Longimicrobiales bacterium]|nr:ATP-binding cassette domain-containing protein [Longimicrobiales bacterium]
MGDDGVSCASAWLAEADRLRRRIGYLADDDALSLDCDVRSNLWEPLRHAPGPLHGPMRMSWALRLAGLDERVLDALPGSLPIGDRRRICVARAILNTPDILLIDSPLRGTDPADHGDILDTLNRSRDTLGATMILALDELCAIPVLADRAVVLSAGRVAFDGDVTAFLRSGIGLDRPA